MNFLPGLSMLSVCFSLDIEPFFYLCHICEEKCEPSRILTHLSSGDHCSNYFVGTQTNKSVFLNWETRFTLFIIMICFVF